MQKGTLLAVLSCALAVGVRAQTYFLLSESTNGVSGPPWPFNPCPSATVYPQGDNKYLLDDRSSVVTFSSLGTTMMTDELALPDPADTNNISTNYDGNWMVSSKNLSFLTNGLLWIEAYSNDTQNIYLQAYNTTNTEFYQIFANTNLTSLFTNWVPGQFQQGDSSTNVTKFLTPIPITNSQTFFRGERGNTVIFVNVNANAYETNATLTIPSQPGSIQFSAQPGVNNPVTVHYSLAGSAQNGIDYTNLSGVATIPGGQSSVTVYVQPISPTTLSNSIETVDFAVQPSTNYLVAPSQYTGTVLIKSSSTTVSVSSSGTDAIRPASTGQLAQDGTVFLFRTDDFSLNPPVTVYYQISGTASDGVDYQLLSGSLTFAQDSTATNVTITPLAESPLHGTKTVTLTLVSSNGYIADSNNFSCTINIYDQTNKVSIASVEGAINSDGPPGAPLQDGAFDLSRSEPHGFYPEITVSYSMSGQAISGVDYTAPTGTVTFAEGQQTASVPIEPISHWTNAAKTVAMTLSPGSLYVLDTNNATRTTAINNSSTRISIVRQQDAIEPNGTNAGQTGVFNVLRDDSRGYSPQLTIYYNLGGTATNGVNYTNLSGAITFAAGESQTNIYIQPFTNSFLVEGRTIIISLIPTNDYFIDTNNAAASLTIQNTGVQFQMVTNLSIPVGIEYNPYLTNLIVSVESGDPTFTRFGTNITVVGGTPTTNLFATNWSGISFLSDEVYMTMVTNNASGFTNGDMFYGNAAEIGWLSSNAAVSNLSWCVLTNATETNTLSFRGGLCMDTVGTFSNNLIAVTSNEQLALGTKGVWEIDAHGHPRLLAHINAYLLEGLAVVRANFGPWSGEIITGDEGTGMLYTVNTNGSVTSIDSNTLIAGGINSESIQIIPPNESLYLCDPSGPLVKVPKSYFVNYVGDLLIEDGGENGTAPAKLFIIHWDAASGTYIVHRIPYTANSGGLEHCIFAPIELPAH